MSNPHEIIAYRINQPPNMGLISAPIERAWMEETTQRFAYRCLPLNIANQNGWFVTCPTTFELYWYGGPDKSEIELRFTEYKDLSITTHFGWGVLTFSLPYLFRTPPDINLWVKGPSNSPKDGIQALEGVVETDWAFSTFTMNWKVTRPCEWIRFEQGEPICMIVPVQRGLIETLVPKCRPLTADPELHDKYRGWEQSRASFLGGLAAKDPESLKRGWQKDYFQGKTAEGGTFDGHQTRLDVKEFQQE
jgi:Family of unknown function (DUF6065)